MRPTKPRRWAAALTALLTALLIALAGCTEERPALPLVLFITLDTTRADHLSCYGYFRETSPRIDALAREGVVFEKAITPMSTTLPAHVSLLTGALPIRHGVESNFENSGIAFASATIRSLAQTLSAAGWTTAGFVSAASLKRHTGIDAGFAVWNEPEDGNVVGELPADVTTDLAIDWLDKAPKREPIFMWVHYFDPHAPYAPPEAYRRFGPSSEQEAFLRARMGAEAAADPAVWDSNDRYDGEILFVDAQIGRLLDKLRDLDLYRDAAIVVVGDHGEGLGQHDWMTHGEIYNEQLFVPLILKLPQGTVKPSRVRDIVSIVDVVPTLAGAVSLPEGTPIGLDGIDVLNGPARIEALAARTSRTRKKWEPGRHYALVTLDWKYLHKTQGDDMLFDMRRDFAERRDVIAEHPDVASRMRARLLAQLASDEGLANRTPGRDAAKISPEVEEQLEALGYVR